MSNHITTAKSLLIAALLAVPAAGLSAQQTRNRR